MAAKCCLLYANQVMAASLTPEKYSIFSGGAAELELVAALIPPQPCSISATILSRRDSSGLLSP